MKIRVFIYDDSFERRESLRALLSLSEEMMVVGEAENCDDCEEDMIRCTPDVVLMDIHMPGTDGISGLKTIRCTHPEIKVLMQTAFDDSDKIFSSIRYGASGYILKRDNPQRILQAIHEVFEGGASMNPAIAQKVLEFFQAPPEKQASPLARKEQEALALLAEGLSYKMVADRMGISYSTVNTYAKRIYEKLHISSLGEAIAWYYKNQS
jgi:DNA-binding NarL/FixJ family response regulator